MVDCGAFVIAFAFKLISSLKYTFTLSDNITRFRRSYVLFLVTAHNARLHRGRAVGSLDRWTTVDRGSYADVDGEVELIKDPSSVRFADEQSAPRSGMITKRYVYALGFLCFF